MCGGSCATAEIVSGGWIGGRCAAGRGEVGDSGRPETRRRGESAEKPIKDLFNQVKNNRVNYFFHLMFPFFLFIVVI